MLTSAPDRATRGIRLAQAGLLINAGLVVVKIVAGIVGRSYALIADGVESSLDIFSSLIVWRGIRVAARSADEDYHFGYGKAESVASAAVAMLLVGAGIGIAIVAVREIMIPHHTPAPFTLVVLVVVIGIKETLFRRVLHEGRELDSEVVQADAWHHRADAITSAAAFIGITIALIGGDEWAEADDWAALLASTVILYNGIRILRPALADLMDRAPASELLEAVSRAGADVAGVLHIEKVLARRAGVGLFVIVHVQADPAMSLYDAHELGGRVRTRLREMRGILDAVIHMEPYVEPHGAKPEGDDGRTDGS